MTAQVQLHTDIGDIRAYVEDLGKQARRAARELARADSGRKNRALEAAADAIEASRKTILSANRQDLETARKNNIAAPLLDRLELNDNRIATMAEGLRQITRLPDPVGEISQLNTRPSGIQVGKMRVPLGVIGIIYESRPNVTADAAALCLKAGNASILRGGSEAFHSNQSIAQCIATGLSEAGLSAGCVQVLDTTDRAAVGAMLKLPEYIDIIIPRGGKGLIERISGESKIPVIKHLDGICHVYIDNKADLEKAVNVAFNAKTRRYGICGAMETLLVAKGIAHQALTPLVAKYAEKNVELRGCERARALFPQIKPATEEDWRTEYLAPILSVRVVDDMDQAIEHIETYGSHHTDAIITEDYSRARRFLAEVDSSSVMVNASTQFADGFEYGLGAEIGISTDKLHVRGPVGLEGLTTQKYIVLGDGNCRE